ncbi:Pol Polyprotein [Phytophthora megakarya]|uniref:Pol Polyprotein n=1 Tax=Phytophthora megakarya TaxID=4795 RepID=A0A225VZM6_9STRA|nr:Pol Polyprotein [Phytophthora megakarya]
MVEFVHFENRFKLAQLLRHTKTRLTSKDQAYMDSPCTANEFYWALTYTAAGKTPGLDGLPSSTTKWTCHFGAASSR